MLLSDWTEFDQVVKTLPEAGVDLQSYQHLVSTGSQAKNMHF